MKGKIYALRIQKMELDRRVVEMQSTMDSLRDEQKVMESAFEEKQNELRTMQEKGTNLGEGGSEITALWENLKQKEAEIQDLKHRLEIPVKTLNDPAIIPETVTGNGTMVAQQDQTENENKDKEEHSLDTAKYEGDDKRVINEDAGKSELTMFKDGEATVRVKDEIQNDEKPGEKNEDPQDEDGAGATAKGIEAEVVEGRGKQAIREENNTNAGDEDSKVKRSANNSRAAATGTKRKHGHVGRTKGKRWKTVVKNKLMESNGMSESHAEVNMGNRKVYREEKGESKGRVVGGVPDEENAASEDKGMGNTREDKPLKPENHETKDARSMIVNDTNQQVTNNDGINAHPEKERLDEDNLVQQNWNNRHINKADKNGGQSKSNGFHEEHEEIEVSDVPNGDDDEDDNGDFFKDSPSDVEDEKEYKEEVDESEFQPDL